MEYFKEVPKSNLQQRNKKFKGFKKSKLKAGTSKCQHQN
jgi:hypothetical protein